MTGKEMRNTIICSGFKIWQIADKLGISDCTLSKKFRYDFSDEDVQKVMCAISELKAQKKDN